MRLLISYPTDVGTFYLGQSNDRKYHPIYNDESLGEYEKVQDAVDGLLRNETLPVYHIETKELVDTSKLGICEDYTQWESLY